MAEGYYRLGHFHAIVPYRPSDILAILKEKGGFDIVQFLEPIDLIPIIDCMKLQ